MFSFIFSHLNLLMFIVWTLFFLVVSMRFILPQWLKNISYAWLAGIAIFMHLIYGVFLTCAQYFVWASGSDVTKFFVSASLPVEAPLPDLLAWSRPFWNHPLGYFAYYSFLHFWLDVGVLFLTAGIIYALLKIWNFYRGGFLSQGPEVILTMLLVIGFPGVFVLVPVSIFLAFLYFGIQAGYDLIRYHTVKNRHILIEPFFIVGVPFVVILKILFPHII